MSWEVILHKEVEDWFLRLSETDEKSADLVEAAIDALTKEGPALGRPLVDRVKQSRHHHMKELRPGSSGSSEIRLLFAFDPTRQALILVSGDKNGKWRSWYDRNIALADARYDEHLENLGRRPVGED